MSSYYFQIRKINLNNKDKEIEKKVETYKKNVTAIKYILKQQ